MHDEEQPRARFRSMTEGTREDWAHIAAAFGPFASHGADRVLTHLRLLAGDFGGFPVDRLEHSLQTASRAARAGRDEEYVVCALLHDIGDTLGAYNHPDIAAAVLKPFVSPKNHWIVQHHGVFQGYYFFHYLGLDRDMREQFRAHEWFDDAAEFCELYDQPSFDKAYPTMALEEFTPLVHRVLSQPKNSVYLTLAADRAAAAEPEAAPAG